MRISPLLDFVDLKKIRQEIMHHTVRLGRMDLFAVKQVPDCTGLLHMYNSNGMDAEVLAKAL